MANGSEEPEQLRKMFLGGLSFDTTEESLQDYFGEFGEITDCCVVRHKDGDRKPRGFGFVTFATSECVDKVIAAKKEQPHHLDGKDIDVKRALPKEDGGPKESVNKAFVGGLSPETTVDELRDYCAQFGTVTDVAIPKSEGRKRIFGFVTFDSTDCVDKIIILPNHELNGRQLEVRKAISKDRRFGGRGGGRGRGDFGHSGGYGGGRYQSGGYGGGGGYGGDSGGYGGGYGSSSYGNSGYDNSGGGYNDYGSGYGQQSSGYGPMKGGSGGGGGYGGRSAPYAGGYGGSSGGYNSGGGGGYNSGGGGGYGGGGYGGGGGGGGGGYSRGRGRNY